MKNSMNVRTDAYAWHTPKIGQLEVVAGGGCVIATATVELATSLLARSSASVGVGTGNQAGLVRVSPFSLCTNGVMFRAPFGNHGSW